MALRQIAKNVRLHSIGRRHLNVNAGNTVFDVGYWVCEKRKNGRWPLLTKEQKSLPCIVKKSHHSGGSTQVDSAGWPVVGYRNIDLFGQNGKPLDVLEIIRNNKQVFGKLFLFFTSAHANEINDYKTQSKTREGLKLSMRS